MRARQLLTAMIRPFTSVYTRFRPGLRILMYHRVCPVDEYDQLIVSPETFRSQVEWLSRHWRVISLEQALAELDAGYDNTPSAVITFDDGYLDNLLHAVPVLEEYNLPATIFVTTEFCAQSQVHPRYAGSGERIHLNWDEVSDLSRRPGIDIGSHTISHPFLTRLEDAEAQREIELSKQQIRNHIGKPVTSFCYPSGNYSKREESIVRNSGYHCAVTVSPGINRQQQDRFALRRTEINNKDDDAALASKMAGAYDPIHLILDWRRQSRFRKLTVNSNQKETR